jgi:hypothetical protein
MKLCPTCKTQYTDDSLTYCLQDGSRLVEAELSMSGETKTIIRDRDSQIGSSFSSAPPKKSMAPMFAAIAVIALVFVIGVVALGAWLLLRDRSSSANNSVTNNQNGHAVNTSLDNKTSTPVPLPSATANTNSKPSPTPSPSPTAEDPDSIRSDVTHRVNDWKAAVESLNIDAVMRNYASTVDYYRHGPSSADFVRSDKIRAFERFNSINVNISNLNVQSDSTGEHATAEFDKEWTFQGVRTTSGKVRSQIKLTKIAGQWLITGERDLRVYYVN